MSGIGLLSHVETPSGASGKTPRGPRCARQARQRLANRTLGRGTLGRGTLGRERKTRVDSWSGDLHRVDSRSGALMHAIATLIR